MKKILVVFALMALGTTTLTAQDLVSFLFVDGDMVQLADNEQVRLEEPIILQDCTVLNPDGSFQTMDGKQLRLKDGECLDMYGIKYRNEYQYRYKVKKENKDLTQLQKQSRYENKFHYVKVDGVVYKIKNQAQNRLRKPFTLKNGFVVDPYGTYKTPDLEEIRLKDGECLNMSGVKFEGMSQYRKVLGKKNRMAQKIK